MRSQPHDTISAKEERLDDGPTNDYPPQASRRTSAARTAFMFSLAAAMGLAAEPVVWQAEDLAGEARVIRGGDLLVITDPNDGRIAFRGGKAMSFVPRGKGSAVELRLMVGQEGVYRLMVRGALGPSCGIYHLTHGGEIRAWLNLGSDRTVHSDKHGQYPSGMASKRILLSRGENRLVFEYQQPGKRGGTLVLDSLELVPHVPRPVPPADPYEAAIPAGEKHGPNLIQNGGFEEFRSGQHFAKQHQIIGHWRYNSAVPKGRKTIVRDASVAYAGKQAILLSPDPLEDYAILYQTFRAESRKQYRVSFQARGQGHLRADFYQYGGKPRPGDSVRPQNTFRATEEWQLYSFVMSPSASGKIHSVALALHATDGSAVYFDEVSVAEILAGEAAE